MNKNFDEFFEELNEMANFKNFGEKEETEEKPLKQCQECICKSCEQVAWLEQENAELKEKIKKYAAINEQETEDYAELKAENERLNRCMMEELHHEGNALRETIKYKQTLQEIKTITEQRNYLDYGEALDDILDLINKAEEE